MIINSMKKLGIPCLFTALFVVMSCGVPPSQRPKGIQNTTTPEEGPLPTSTPTPSNTPDPGPGAEPVSLYLFGAPPCAPCKKEIPTLQERIKSEFGALADKIQVTVYVTSGQQFIDPPTDAVSQEWAKSMNVTFKMVNDLPFKCKLYKSYFDKSCAVPASVILNKAGEPITKFPASAVDRTDEIMAKLHELVK